MKNTPSGISRSGIPRSVVATRSGVVLLHKPVGSTSFQVLAPLKARYGPKVGHSGTLDPFAQGLIVALCGSFTRLSSYFSTMTKEYRATICFGAQTDTLDTDGSINSRGPVPTLRQILTVLPQFRGQYQQQVPEYSAVHINGSRAYTLARQGISFTPPSKLVTIHSLFLHSYKAPYAKISLCCSSGTYVRALARDIALACGTCAHLVALTRTQVGNFSLSNAAAEPVIIPPKEISGLVPEIGTASVQAQYRRGILNGIPFRPYMASTVDTLIRGKSLLLLFDADETLLAACQPTGAGNYRYLFVAG